MRPWCQCSVAKARVVFPFKQSYCRPVNGTGPFASADRRRGRLRMSFTIAHITDPHLSPAPMPGFADLRLKRVMGFINWKRGRERLNDMALLKRLVEDLRAQRPDHVAVTGDLVNIGMAAEFQRAALWMETLGDASDVSFVPGNHDAYVRASMPLLEATFAPWTASDAHQGGATFPYLRIRRDVAAAARSFGRGRVPESCARLRGRGDPARAYPPTGCPLASLTRRAHGRGRGSGPRRALSRRPPARPALSRRLSPGPARSRGRALAGRREGPGAHAGKRGDRRTR